MESTRKSVHQIVGVSRFMIVLAIAGIMLSAITTMIVGFIVVLKTVWETFSEAHFEVEDAKHLTVVFIEMTDLFLFGMVLYVVTVGMYTLFIDERADVPAWMRVKNLSELKTQLINVIVVLLAVSFLAISVTWTSDRSILYFGCAIAVVIISLAAFNYVHHGQTDAHIDEADDDRAPVEPRQD
jgi:uncharacterized membrane protein YqhA